MTKLNTLGWNVGMYPWTTTGPRQFWFSVQPPHLQGHQPCSFHGLGGYKWSQGTLARRHLVVQFTLYFDLLTIVIRIQKLKLYQPFGPLFNAYLGDRRTDSAQWPGHCRLGWLFLTWWLADCWPGQTGLCLQQECGGACLCWALGGAGQAERDRQPVNSFQMLVPRGNDGLTHPAGKLLAGHWSLHPLGGGIQAGYCRWCLSPRPAWGDLALAGWRRGPIQAVP